MCMCLCVCACKHVYIFPTLGRLSKQMFSEAYDFPINKYLIAWKYTHDTSVLFINGFPSETKFCLALRFLFLSFILFFMFKEFEFAFKFKNMLQAEGSVKCSCIIMKREPQNFLSSLPEMLLCSKGLWWFQNPLSWGYPIAMQSAPFPLQSATVSFVSDPSFQRRLITSDNLFIHKYP